MNVMYECDRMNVRYVLENIKITKRVALGHQTLKEKQDEEKDFVNYQ